MQSGAACGTSGFILNSGGYCHIHGAFPPHALCFQNWLWNISMYHSLWISSVGVFKAFSAQLTTNLNERIETHSFVFINHGHNFLQWAVFLKIYDYLLEGDNSSALEDCFDKTTVCVVKKEKKSSQFLSQFSHVIKSKSNKAAKRHFLLSVQQAPRAFYFFSLERVI